LAAVDVGKRRFRIIGIHFHERADGEGIVILLTEQEDLHLVPVDRENIVARAAIKGGRLADAIAQEAVGHLSGLEVVLGKQAIKRVGPIAGRLIQLPDLEGVVARAAEHRHRRETLVEDKVIIPIQAGDLDAVDAAVVVDPLEEPAGNGLATGIHLE